MKDSDHILAELILFISERSEGDARFGAVKLNKLLFYCDFAAFLLLGKSITGQEYQKLPNGPAPRRLIPVREELVDTGKLALRKVEYFNRHQDRTFALIEPDVTVFDSRQVALVTTIIESNWERNASQISHMSHQFHGWEDAEPNETIPYELAMLSGGPPTERDASRCLADVEKARLVASGARKVVLSDA